MKQLKREMIMCLCGIVGIGLVISLIVLILNTLAYLDFRDQFSLPPYDETKVYLHQMATGVDIEISDEDEKRRILDSMQSIQFAGIRPEYEVYSSDDDPYSIHVLSNQYNTFYYNIFVIGEIRSANFVNGNKYKIRLKNTEGTLMIVRELIEKSK